MVYALTASVSLFRSLLPEERVDDYVDSEGRPHLVSILIHFERMGSFDVVLRQKSTLETEIEILHLDSKSKNLSSEPAHFIIHIYRAGPFCESQAEEAAQTGVRRLSQERSVGADQDPAPCNPGQHAFLDAHVSTKPSCVPKGSARRSIRRHGKQHLLLCWGGSPGGI